MGPVGETWNCPHCGQRILRSAVSCPACQRRLRFDAAAAAPAAATSAPLRVEGTIRQAATDAPAEYSVLVQIRDAQGAVLARHVVGVGVIQPGDERVFSLHVEVHGSEQPASVAAASRAIGERERSKAATPPKKP